MLRKRFDRKTSGMTLIETLVVISVGLTVIALALTVYNSVNNKMNVKSETENLSIIYTGVRDLYSEETTSEMDNKVLIEAGVIPDKMKVIGETIRNTWGGEVTFEGDSDDYNFSVEYKNVPSGSVCIDLVRNQRKIGWETANVGNGDIDYSDFKVTELTESCADDSGKVQITFNTGDGK